MRRRIVSTALLLVVGSSLAGAVFELGVRWLEPQPETRYRYSPDTWIMPVPGDAFVYERQEFRVPVRFNACGMRDVPRQIECPSKCVRVALLGDSFAEALQVPQDSMISQALERDLRACLPSQRVEVLNFGVSGFGTAATAARYRGLGSRFGPDVVLYLFVANDVTDLLGFDARLYEMHGDDLVLRRVELEGVDRWRRRLLDFAKAHSHSYRFLRYRMLRVAESERLQSARERGRQAQVSELLPEEVAWQRFAAALRLLQALVRADGADFLLVQATTYGPVMTARLEQICATLGVQRFDLVPLLAMAPLPVTYAIDGHWRAAGHRLAAAAVAPVVCGLLEASEPRRQLAR